MRVDFIAATEEDVTDVADVGVEGKNDFPSVDLLRNGEKGVMRLPPERLVGVFSIIELELMVRLRNGLSANCKGALTIEDIRVLLDLSSSFFIVVWLFATVLLGENN